jgi:hypothetical protein
MAAAQGQVQCAVYRGSACVYLAAAESYVYVDRSRVVRDRHSGSRSTLVYSFMRDHATLIRRDRRGRVFMAAGPLW